MGSNVEEQSGNHWLNSAFHLGLIHKSIWQSLTREYIERKLSLEWESDCQIPNWLLRWKTKFYQCFLFSSTS